MNSMLVPAILLLMCLATGCASKSTPPATASANTSALDVAPAPAPAPVYTPAPTVSPVMASADPIVSTTPSSIGTTAAGGSYTVKKGDTLYAIAKSHYGDGKQWQKIASANPGLTPQTLRVGQTLTLP